MKKMILIFTLLFIAFGVFSQKKSNNSKPNSSVIFRDSIKTYQIQLDASNFTELKAKAKKEKKLILIKFDCSLCMDNNTLVCKDSTVANFYNRHFVSKLYIAEEGEGVQMAKQYKIANTYPTFIFADSEGNMLHRRCGFKVISDTSKTATLIRATKDYFLEEQGKIAMDSSKRLSALILKFKLGNRDVEFIEEIYKSMQEACMPYIDTKEVSELYFKNQKRDSLFSIKNWNIINFHVSNFNSSQFQFLLEHQKKYYSLYGELVNKKILKVCLTKTVSIANDKIPERAIQYEEFKDELKKKKLTNEGAVLAETDLVFYYTLKDWQKYADVATSGVIEKYYFDNTEVLNRVCWLFAEHIDDLLLLKKALSWAKCAIELKDDESSNDAYANLLFKLGRVQEAIVIEKKALKLAIENNSDAIETIKRNLAKFERK